MMYEDIVFADLTEEHVFFAFLTTIPGHSYPSNQTKAPSHKESPGAPKSIFVSLPRRWRGTGSVGEEPTYLGWMYAKGG